jgi:hypothetical protein
VQLRSLQITAPQLLDIAGPSLEKREKPGAEHNPGLSQVAGRAS